MGIIGGGGVALQVEVIGQVVARQNVNPQLPITAHRLADSEGIPKVVDGSR